ncbi:MAG: DsrE family protein [Acidihalobacter sp.]
MLQISDASAQKQALVLNVAGNLMKHYGADKLDLEVVAFGPGLRMLLDDNVNKARIRALAKNYDVKFDACGNTLGHFTKKLGYRPKLVPEATVVPAGAARIVQLETHGYVLIRP